MAGFENTQPISGNFGQNANTVVLEVSDMKIDKDKFTFKLPDALSHADDVKAASRVVVTQDKKQFLEAPNSCAHVTISQDDLSREGYNLFSGTATIGVKNLNSYELQQAVEYGQHPGCVGQSKSLKAG